MWGVDGRRRAGGARCRINSITAVTWFFTGTNGGFTCWPDGPAGDALKQTDMWNTAIAGDNDFVYHRVERLGPNGTTSPDGTTASSTLYERLSAAYGADFAAAGNDELFDEPSRLQLMKRWPGFLPV